jgi:hypothetical protein
MNVVRSLLPPPPQGIKPMVIDYVDTDGFDLLLETSLTNQDPAIVIQTHFPQPNWGPRLNAWLAAWNTGGKVDGAQPGRKARGQLPSVTINEGSIREFRLLVDGLMNRVEELARNGSAWWAEEKVRKHRIDLLRPYNLRFHMDEEKNIQIILFNGRYAASYAQFVQSFAESDEENPLQWTRSRSCSRCRQLQAGAATANAAGQPMTGAKGP